MLCSGDGGGISLAPGMQAGVWLCTHPTGVTSALTLPTAIRPQPNVTLGCSQPGLGFLFHKQCRTTDNIAAALQGVEPR